MSERLVKCPLCKSGNVLNHLEVKDLAVSKKTFILCRCDSCQLLFTNPRPNEEEIGPYYDFPEYYSHEDKVTSITQWLYQKIRNYSLKKKVALIDSLVTKGTVYDYGCGTGQFIQQAATQGWQVKGIEPNEKARAQASKKNPDSVLSSITELQETDTADVITLFHVLEHIHALRKTVKRILTHLKSGGYLIIAVPNHRSADAQYYGSDWAGWDVPRHLYHFNTAAMEAFQAEFDLEKVSTLPMVFDSYYVSLLSEKYRNPTASLLMTYLRASYQGFLSNKKAAKPGDYSSNIFIYRKK
jgi:2-polyprenyl-3-methyl-5-hydroxy-6-metoxy-1,4-benzoquinol methylase